MKHAKGVLLLFSFLIIFGTMNIMGNTTTVFDQGIVNTTPHQKMLPAYTPHGVITIVNDSDFALQDLSESWPGNGSEEDPYIIQGYNITNDVAVSIAISDVSAYFEIRDCLITSTSHQNVGGVTLNNVTHAYLENCIISYKNTGLEIDNSDGISVVNCTMDNNADGATVDTSNHTTFTDCHFTYTTTGSGFYQDSSHWTTITDCYLNYNGDYGLESYYCDYFVFTGNEVMGNDYAGLLVENSHYGEYQDNTIFANEEEGIKLSTSHLNTVTENTIYDNWGYGLYLQGTQYGVFSHNTIYNNTLEGINFDVGAHSILEANTVYESGWTIVGLGGAASGILLSGTTNCSVLENDVYNNTAHGIYLEGATDCAIKDNTVWGNYGIMGECGIYVQSSTFCNITHNIVYNNTENGIFLEYGEDLIVSHNIVYDNTEYGILLDDCNRTLLYYNDIGWNQWSAHASVGSTSINHWDDGEFGNWWSDYGGSGPYNISGPTGEQDMHPSNSLVVGSASDVEYELGSTGNTLFIAAEALNPGYYEVIIGTAMIGTFEWNGGNIYADIDDLDVGVYPVTVHVYHVSGHSLSSAATVTVVDTTAPAWVSTPTDQTIELGDTLNYQIQVTEFSEIDEWIVNDTVHFSIVDGLLTNNVALELGDYGLNITVVDIYGNARTALITIHVIEPTIPPGGDPTGVLLIIAGGAGAAVVVVILVIVMKKRS